MMCELERNLVLLAGSTEAGKSTAGEAFAKFGASRIKIRDVILELSSGSDCTLGGAKTRVGFDQFEFLSAISSRRGEYKSLAVIESFIDPSLADCVKKLWQYGRCYVLYIDAPIDVRVDRLVNNFGYIPQDARRVVYEKDVAKGLPATLKPWEKISDHWIINASSLNTYLSRLRRIHRLLTSPLDLP